MAEGEQAPPPTSAVLMSISRHIGHSCAKVNQAYVECKKKDKDPRACLKEGEGVTRCAIDLLRSLKDRAPDELKAYYECMDYYSNNFEKCRKEQQAFEDKVPYS